MATTTSYLDQVKSNYACGSYRRGLKSGTPETEALTNYVMFSLQKAKDDANDDSAFAAWGEPSLQDYLTQLECGGFENFLSAAEAWYIMGQIVLFQISQEA